MQFKTKDGWEAAQHTARFGEIEQRGAALTPKGRALYDQCLAASKRSEKEHDRALEEAFADFPDNWETLEAETLIYMGTDGTPQTYEDFLPVSAAGIFRSNLRSSEDKFGQGSGDQAGFEKAMGGPCLDMFELYAASSP